MDATVRLALIARDGSSSTTAPSLAEALCHAGIDRRTPDRLLATLPFAGEDATAGSETELQAAVRGERHQVDLPRTIETSRYMTNLLKRARAGDTPDRLAGDLERFLSDNPCNIWENSAVCFPYRALSAKAREVFHADLLADKRNPGAGRRGDAGRFLFETGGGESQIRVPISYLIKLALADVIDTAGVPATISATGRALMDHYLNDNTSPETHSFHVVPLRAEAGLGKALARETAKRHLLTALLIRFANRRFELLDHGQQAMIYFAPHPPQRQEALNTIIPDSFYRELFMSPCLSGWDRGEEKHHYMHLCHQTLSRSQINAVTKLREAGIVPNNLVVLPTLSNTSLANNGVHVSLGSRRLTARLASPGSGFQAAHEKLLGDLAIKIAEHFLPLFVGSYTAAPYRLGFVDFHPERALGFLPHQLDYTHLRMLWRRWRKKARLSVCGQSLTPFGPEWLDRTVSRSFGLAGDFVPDFRLLDYPVCFLSSERSPAFDGRLGNHDQLKEDLAEMGITDRQMSLYLFLKPREFATIGFSGVEGRHYSMFESFGRDLGQATSLQTLIIAFAYQLIATGAVTHADIPDDPVTESERRQIFFGTAINLPTFFVKADTPNRFLRGILARTRQIRSSSRYPGYLRIYHAEYRRALVQMLREEATGLIESFRLGTMLDDLGLRLDFPGECATSGRLTKGILEQVNATHPMKVEAGEFNRAAETYYRETLAQKLFEESLDYFVRDLERLDRVAYLKEPSIRAALDHAAGAQGAGAFLDRIRADLLDDRLDLETMRKLIYLVIFTIHRDQLRSRLFLGKHHDTADDSSVYRAG